MRGFYRYGMRPPRFGFTGYDRVVECPESGCTVECSDCHGCENYGVWRKGDAAMCWHEYRELKSQGYYVPGQQGWMGYLRNADPETWKRLVEEEKNNERVRQELKQESAELRSRSAIEDDEQEEQVDVDETIELEDEEDPSDDTESEEDLDEDEDAEESDDENENLDEEEKVEEWDDELDD